MSARVPRVEAATEGDIRWVSQLAARTYSGIDAIPQTVMLEWWRANPSGFSVIKSASGSRIGNIDILPLKPEALARFATGELIEREIRGQDLYATSESRLITDLYIESMVCANALAAGRALRSFASLSARICDTGQLRSVFAITASAKGERLAGRLGFEIVSPASRRRDSHDLLRVDYRRFFAALM